MKLANLNKKEFKDLMYQYTIGEYVYYGNEQSVVMAAKPYVYEKLLEKLEDKSLFYAYSEKPHLYFNFYPYILKGQEDIKDLFLFSRYFSFYNIAIGKSTTTIPSREYTQAGMEKIRLRLNEIYEYVSLHWKASPIIAMAYLLFIRNPKRDPRISYEEGTFLKHVCPIINNLASIEYDEFEDFSYQFKKTLFGYKRIYSVPNKTKFNWKDGVTLSITKQMDFSKNENYTLKEESEDKLFRQTFENIFLHIEPLRDERVKLQDVELKLQVAPKDRKEKLLLQKEELIKKIDLLKIEMQEYIDEVKRLVQEYKEKYPITDKSESFKYVYKMMLKSLDGDLNMLQSFIDDQKNRLYYF